MVPTLYRTVAVPRDLNLVATTNADEETAAADVGADPNAIAAAWTAATNLYASGIHPAIQVCVRYRGKVVLDRAIGHAAGNGPADSPDTVRKLATPSTPFNIFSASKAITAMVIHLLEQERALHLDDRVCDHIPEFAAHGKEQITIRHVLLHRAGVPHIPGAAMNLDNLSNRQAMVDIMCDVKPTARAGGRQGYHALSGGFILGEIVYRVTGKSIREVLAERILAPLGFRWTNYGVAPEDIDQVALSYFTGPLPVPGVSHFIHRALGIAHEEAVELSNDSRFLTGILPAGNVVTTARELTRFYQLLLDGGILNGTRIFDARTVERATREQTRQEFDYVLGMPIRFSHGFMLGARWVSLFGPDTREAYGHLGFSNIVAWADPKRQLTAALMTSGKPLLYPGLYHAFDLLRQIGNISPKH